MPAKPNTSETPAADKATDDKAPAEKAPQATEAPTVAAQALAPTEPAPTAAVAPTTDEQGPVPDDYGRFRVKDLDTGHERTVHAAELGHGNYEVLDEPASDLAGDPVPVKLATHESLSGPTTSGQSADSKKENTDA